MGHSFIRSIGATVVGLIALSGMPLEARTAAVVDAVESGDDVVFTTQPGSNLDLTGMSFNGLAGHSATINPIVGLFQVGDSQSTHVYFPPAITPMPFGSGAGSSSSSGTGDLFGVEFSGTLVVPSTYSSGDPLNGSATYAGQTFASLGLTPGSYVLNLPNDTITLNIVAAVPISGTVSLFVAVLVCWTGCAALLRTPSRLT